MNSSFQVLPQIFGTLWLFPSHRVIYINYLVSMFHTIKHYSKSSLQELRSCPVFWILYTFSVQSCQKRQHRGLFLGKDKKCTGGKEKIGNRAKMEWRGCFLQSGITPTKLNKNVGFQGNFAWLGNTSLANIYRAYELRTNLHVLKKRKLLVLEFLCKYWLPISGQGMFKSIGLAMISLTYKHKWKQ